MPEAPSGDKPVLSHQRILALRKHYDAELAGALTVAALSKPWPPGAEWMKAQVSLFYKVKGAGEPVLSGKDRERTVIALLAASHTHPGNLALHVYWGIVEGLRVDHVRESVALAGMYAGVPVYTDGMAVVDNTLALLARQPKDKLDVLSIATAIGLAYPRATFVEASPLGHHHA